MALIRRFGEWIVVFLILFILLLAFLAVGRFSVDPRWVQAFASFSAVAVALGLAVEQRIETNRQRVSEQTRKHNANRANLHVSISRIYSYSTACMQNMRQVVFSRRTENEWSISDFPHLDIVKPSADVFRDVAECISTCADERTSSALATLIRWTQIQTARLDKVTVRAGETVMLPEVFECICDAACLQAMAGLCFPYARFAWEDINIDISRDMIEQRLYMNEFFKDDPRLRMLYIWIDRHVELMEEISNLQTPRHEVNRPFTLPQNVSPFPDIPSSYATVYSMEKENKNSGAFIEHMRDKFGVPVHIKGLTFYVDTSEVPDSFLDAIEAKVAKFKAGLPFDD